MISSKNIRFHSPSNTYIIPKNSILDQNIAVKGNVIVGSGTRFWKNIKIDGNIQFGKGCVIEGNLKANQIIVGSRSIIKGNITADSDVSLFQKALVCSVESGGNITIMPGCVVGYANGSTLSVIGKAEIRKIGVITKVTVRANTVSELTEDPENIDSENIDSEGIGSGGLKLGAGDEIGINDSNTFQTVSEELIFENDIIDKAENKSVDINENEIENEAGSYSSETPQLPMEQSNEKDLHDTEINKIYKINKVNANSEDTDTEIIDETDEKSPKSFTVSAFSGSSADHLIRVPEDESSEVEIIGDSNDSNLDVSDSDSALETVYQKIETPFGMKTIPVKRSDSSDNQFASVTGSTRGEQQADFEAEMKIKSGTVKSETVKSETMKFETVKSEAIKSETVKSEAIKSETVKSEAIKSETVKSETAHRKSEFRWPAFEPKKTPKTEKANIKNNSAPADNNLFSRMTGSSQIEYEEIKIRSAPKQKEFFSNPRQINISEQSNQKLIFEEINPAAPSKTQVVPKSKADILMEKMNFDTAAEKPEEAKLNAEKKVRSQKEVENSKVWYEERCPRSESKKKEYPPYI